MKVRIYRLDASLFIFHVELKSSFLVAHVNILAMKRKAHYLVTMLRLKLLLRILGPSMFLSTIHYLVQFPKGFT